jgi:transcriptional/translational regulatory protein YebC/TACO1
VRSLLTKGGGSLGESGCVSYLFQRKGIISYDASRYSEDQVFEAALEAGAEDVTREEESIEVVTTPDDFESVLKALQGAGFEEEMAEVSMVPETTVTLNNEATKKALRLIERIDDHDDVQSVATNLDIPEGFDPDEE